MAYLTEIFRWPTNSNKSTGGRGALHAIYFIPLPCKKWPISFRRGLIQSLQLDKRDGPEDEIQKASVIFREVDRVHKLEDMKEDEQTSFKTWFKVLFDSSSEGIGDTILRYGTSTPSEALIDSYSIVEQLHRRSCYVLRLPCSRTQSRLTELENWMLRVWTTESPTSMVLFWTGRLLG